MIIVKLWGGLGNQLFQYAFGYAIAKERHTELALDLSFYAHQPGNVGKRKIDLEKMNVEPYSLFKPGVVLNILNNKYVGAITRNLSHVELNVGSDIVYFKEPIHRYVEHLPAHSNIYFDGYWQSARYFRKYREEIRNMFVSAAGYSDEVEKVAEKMQCDNSVSIHMRKGDFGNGTIRKVGHPLGAEYYQKAISCARERLTKPVFYVFSDNTEWARQTLGLEDSVVYVADLCKTNALDDLYLMAKCKNGIMSASTFSWWGNWLRAGKGTIIVPQGEYYNNFFYEEEWVKI